MKKLLITGASGFVGSRVVARWRNEYAVLAPSHSELDITDRTSVDSYFLQHTPDVVVHLAALSNTGYCEQNPDDWNEALCENTKKLLEKSGIFSGDIIAVAIDSATHTWVATDENYTPLFPAIHWTDSRSKKQSAFLRENFGEKIFQKTFHKPDTIWTLPQLIWLKETEPKIFEKTKYIFFEKDYVRYYVTGVFCTDYIEAEGSMLFDCRNMRWDASLCALAGIDPAVLPPIVSPTDMIGAVTKEAARATGLLEGTPVICGTTDAGA